MDDRKFRVVVNKSTVPVGSGNLVGAFVRDGVLETHPDLVDDVRFGIASNPEFLREGSAIHDSLYPDRIVLGAEDEGTIEILLTLYRPLVEQDFVDRPRSRRVRRAEQRPCPCGHHHAHQRRND